MTRSTTKGIFVPVEGPNGVGKSTLVESIRRHLGDAACDVCTTKEPTDSKLGRWIRANQRDARGTSLACLVAADRYQHIESVIKPALDRNTVVLTDRYLASSFVYQVSDGVHRDFIWAVNSLCMAADLTVCIFAMPCTISARMANRPSLTRFEQSISPKEEIDLYRQACDILRGRGWRVEEHNNEDGFAEVIAANVAETIVKMRASRHV